MVTQRLPLTVSQGGIQEPSGQQPPGAPRRKRELRDIKLGFALKNVFPGRGLTIENFFFLAEERPEEVIRDLRAAGRNRDTEDILSVFDLTPEDINEILQPTLRQPVAAPTDFIGDIGTGGLGRVEPDLRQLIERMAVGGITPEEDDEILGFLRERGRTPEVESILTEAGISPEDFDEILGAELIQPAPVSLTTEGNAVRKGFVDNFWDSFLLESRRVLHDTTQFFTRTFPTKLLQDIPPELISEESRLVDGQLTYTQEEAARINQFSQTMRDKFRSVYARNEQKQVEWLEKHPDLQPEPRFDKPLWGNWDLLLEAGYWSQSFGKIVPYSLAILGTTVAVTYATKNPYAGLMAGWAVATPVISRDLEKDLLEAGAPEDTAADLAVTVGSVISGIETAANLPILGALFTPFKLFRKQLTKEVSKRTIGSMAKKGITTFGIVEITESLTEGLQEVVQNFTVKFFDENRGLFDNVREIIVQTMVGIAPIAIFGGGMSMRHQPAEQAQGVSPEQKKAEGWKQDKITQEWYKPEPLVETVESDTKQFIDEEFSTGEARMKALNEAAKTPEGEKAISEAAKKIEAEQVVKAPVPELIPKVEAVPEVVAASLDETLSQKHPQVDAFVSERADSIKLHTIRVSKELQRQGIGTAYINDLIAHADEVGKTITLSTGGRGFDFPKSKLITFYKRFGFVENKGRNLDLRISDTMFRRPQAPSVTPPTVEAVKVPEIPTVNEKRIAEIKKILETPGRTPKGVGTRGELEIELARLETQQEIVDSVIFVNGDDALLVEVIDDLISATEIELGTRPLPFQAGRKATALAVFKTPQLDERLKVLLEFRETLPEPTVEPAPPIAEVKPPTVEEAVQKEQVIQKAKQDAFVETKETENITKAGEDALNAQSEAAGLPPPNQPPGMTGHIGSGGKNPENGLYDLTNRIIETEDAGRAALRIWDGTRNRLATETIAWWRKGNKTLKAMGVGTTDGKNQRLTSEDSLDLFKALHGEGKVPANLQSVFDELKTFLDQEASDMLAFDPTFSRVMMAHPDYFPRGWRPPREGKRIKLGAKPGFLKPRVDATFTEMIDAGWEPISWNPYDMVALRRMAGTEYREGRILISRLKTYSKAIAEHDAPREGWRVPKVGPAFEGKPFVGADGKAYMTPKVSTPNNVADVLESIYGVPIEFRVAGIDIWSVIRKFGAVTKRAKLFASLFQHVDFLTRDLIVAFTPTGIRHGLPLKFPALAARISWSAVSPASRANLEVRILSGEPLYADSDITLKMVADGGWKLGQDELLIRRDVREQLESIVKDAQEEGLKVRWFQRAGQGVVKVTDPVIRRLSATARFFEAGLFDGIYRESQAYALEHVIIPRIRRSHPTWTTEQVAGSAAEEVNKNFSTLGVWQSVVQQPATREFVRTMFFSWNESEALIRQATSTVKGKNVAYWREYQVATFIALALVANAINMISEGEPLPPDRYLPFKMGSPYSPMPGGIAYNEKFLSPRLPWDGRNGQPIYLDIVGQMDTWMRWLLDPASALTARVNVFPRAILNQIKGEDFWGRELKDFPDRVKQATLDLFAPIGAGNLLEVIRLQWPDVGFIPESEGRIGIVGSLIQATGLNVRSINTRDMLDKFARESGLLKADGTPVTSWSDLEPHQKRKLEKNKELQIELGLRSVVAVERQYPGAEGFAKLDKIDQERIVRGEALVSELVSDLIGIDRGESFDAARAFRAEVSRLKKEVSDRKAQINEDFQLFKDTGELPTDPNKRALVEYYNIFEKAKRPSGVMDWEKVNELELALRDAWTPVQGAYVDRNIGLTEWGPLMQEFVDAQRTLSDSGYWDEPIIDRKVFRLEHPEIEEILTGKFYNQKPIEGEAEKISLKWQDVYRQLDSLKDMGLTDEQLEEQKESIYNENPGFFEDDRRKTAWNAIGDLLDEDRSLVFVSEFVDYSNIVREFSANSSQAKLYRFDSKELNDLGTQDGTFSTEGWGELEESKVPAWRINVKYEVQDNEYDAIDGDDRQARDKYLEDNPDYAEARRQRDAFSIDFPENRVDNYVEYYSLPSSGFRQERYLVEHPDFAQSLNELKGIDLPDPSKVPSVKYDDLLEKETRTPEEELQLKAYGKFFPDKHIDNYVGYYTILNEGKPKGVDLWYEDDWFLIEHIEFYREARDRLGWERRDFTKVPTREVFRLFETYQDLPSGNTRLNFRIDNPELDEWLVIKFGYTPVGGRTKKEPTELTDEQQRLEDIRERLAGLK